MDIESVFAEVIKPFISNDAGLVLAKLDKSVAESVVMELVAKEDDESVV